MCTEIGLCSALKTKAKELKVRAHGCVCLCGILGRYKKIFITSFPNITSINNYSNPFILTN